MTTAFVTVYKKESNPSLEQCMNSQSVGSKSAARTVPHLMFNGLTFPKYASAISFILVNTMEDISSG